MKLTLGYNRFTHCTLRYIVRRRRRQDEKTFLRKMSYKDINQKNGRVRVGLLPDIRGLSGNSTTLTNNDYYELFFTRFLVILSKKSIPNSGCSFCCD